MNIKAVFMQLFHLLEYIYDILFKKSVNKIKVSNIYQEKKIFLN